MIIPDFVPQVTPGLGPGCSFRAASEPFWCDPSLSGARYPPVAPGMLPTLLALFSAGLEIGHISEEPGSFGGWDVGAKPGALAVFLAAGQPVLAGVCGHRRVWP